MRYKHLLLPSRCENTGWIRLGSRTRIFRSSEGSPVDRVDEGKRYRDRLRADVPDTNRCITWERWTSFWKSRACWSFATNNKAQLTLDQHNCPWKFAHAIPESEVGPILIRYRVMNSSKRLAIEYTTPQGLRLAAGIPSQVVYGVWLVT